MFKNSLILVLTLLFGSVISTDSGSTDVTSVSSGPGCPVRCRNLGSDGAFPADCSPRCRPVQDSDVDFGTDQGSQDFVPTSPRYRSPYYRGPRPVYPPRPYFPGPGRPIRGRRCAVTHVVREGDSCWAISRMYGLTVGQLEFLNPGLDCRQTIYPGQVFCVA